MGAASTKVKDHVEFLDSPRKSSPMIGTIDAAGKKLEPKSSKHNSNTTTYFFFLRYFFRCIRMALMNLFPLFEEK